MAVLSDESALGLAFDNADEIERPVPNENRGITGWAELVKPLALRMENLGEGKCIRIRKALSVQILAALRHQLSLRGFRLIVRIRTGETYLWRGIPLSGNARQLRK